MHPNNKRKSTGEFNTYNIRSQGGSTTPINCYKKKIRYSFHNKTINLPLTPQKKIIYGIYFRYQNRLDFEN